MAVVEVSILVSNTIGSGGTGTWGTFCGVFSRDVFGAVSSVESVVDLLDVFGDVGIALAVVVTAYILTQIQSRIGHLRFVLILIQVLRLVKMLDVILVIFLPKSSITGCSV